MTDPRPVLAFAPPISGPIPPAQPGFPRPPRGPGGARQRDRLTPQFAALRDAIQAERARLTDSTTEPDPELVAVLDVAGTVDDFVKAAAKVDGLEFLAEEEEDPVAADDDFYVEVDDVRTDKDVSETMYVVMSNARAVGELVSLFDLWTANPKMRFAHGLAPLRHVFSRLRAIRRWGPEDRIRETGLLEAWSEDVAVGGQSFSRVEIELWFRDDLATRTASQTRVEELVTDAGGVVLASSVRPELDYHAVLADLPYNQVRAVLDRGADAIELLKE